MQQNNENVDFGFLHKSTFISRHFWLSTYNNCDKKRGDQKLDDHFKIRLAKLGFAKCRWDFLAFAKKAGLSVCKILLYEAWHSNQEDLEDFRTQAEKLHDPYLPMIWTRQWAHPTAIEDYERSSSTEHYDRRGWISAYYEGKPWSRWSRGASLPT